VKVVRLDRVVDDARAGVGDATAEGVLERGDDRVATEVGEPIDDARGDVDRRAGVVERADAVVAVGTARVARLAPGARAASAAPVREGEAVLAGSGARAAAASH
jgi:hypothetical protein